VLLALVAFDSLRFDDVRGVTLAPGLRLPVGALLSSRSSRSRWRAACAPAVSTCKRAATSRRATRAPWSGSPARAPADALVATVDIGLLGWRLPNPLLDLGGIVASRAPACAYAQSAARRPWRGRRRSLGWLEERRPEYVVVFPRWFPLLERDPARFPVLARFARRGQRRDGRRRAGDLRHAVDAVRTRRRALRSDSPRAIPFARRRSAGPTSERPFP
jgi:hypothetical protein